jgi:hypothetical protein
MVVSIIEITQIALLVTVGRAEPFMARMIRHDAIVRKCGSRGERRWVITRSARGDGWLFAALTVAGWRSVKGDGLPVA